MPAPNEPNLEPILSEAHGWFLVNSLQRGLASALAQCFTAHPPRLASPVCLS